MFSHNDFSLQSVFAVLSIIFNNLAVILKLKIASPVVSTDIDYHDKNLSDQVVIVTGSNTGIGKATAAKLMQCGATVVLACRNTKQGMKAMMELTDKSEKLDPSQYPYARNSKAFFMRLDLSDLKSVNSFVVRFKEQFNRLDILVNNAGLNTAGTTTNGLEQLFQVNYLGHYLLTRLLEDLLTSSAVNQSGSGENIPETARVVNLSSTMHHLGQGDYEASAFSSYSAAMVLKGYSYYSDSKLYMNLLSMEINRRFDHQKPYGPAGVSSGEGKRPIVSICANPGAVHSDIWRSSVLSYFSFVMRWLFLDVEQGCTTSVRAATIPLEELRAYQRGCAANYNQAALGDNFVFCPDIPCLVPYAVSGKKLRLEIMGPFAGPRFNGVTFPVRTTGGATTPEQLSAALWEYSWRLCESQAKVSMQEAAPGVTVPVTK